MEKGNFLRERVENLIVKGGYASFSKIEGEKELDVFTTEYKTALLNEFCGKQVILDCRTMNFDAESQLEFPNCIRVSGVLELNAKLKQYRVVFSDGNYSYFEVDNVIMFGSYGKGKTFQCGSECLFALKF